MSTVATITVSFMGVLVAAVALLRIVSRHHSTACPAWRGVLLENPYMEAVAGSRVILERAQIQIGTEVLDVGAGPGRLTIPAAQRVTTLARVVALDIQPSMIARLQSRIAAKQIENVDVILGGAGEGLLPHNRFDCALLVTVLGEIPDQVSALREIHDALKPEGILSVTEVIPDPHYQSRCRVQRLASAAGFQHVDSFGRWYGFTLNFMKVE